MSTATEVETTTDDDREKEAGERGPRPGRKRKRRKKRRDRMRKVSVDESVFDPSNSIKRGDIIEYTVKEDKVLQLLKVACRRSGQALPLN